ARTAIPALALSRGWRRGKLEATSLDPPEDSSFTKGRVHRAHASSLQGDLYGAAFAFVRTKDADIFRRKDKLHVIGCAAGFSPNAVAVHFPVDVATVLVAPGDDYVGTTLNLVTFVNPFDAHAERFGDAHARVGRAFIFITPIESNVELGVVFVRRETRKIPVAIA